MASGKPVWELSAFRSFFGDPFAEGNDLESPSHCAESYLVLSHMLSRQLSTPSNWMSETQIQKVGFVQSVVKKCFERSVAAMQAQDPATFNTLLIETMKEVEAIPNGQIEMIPGGWRGTLSVGWVTHLIERSVDGQSFNFTTFNLGQGMEYHLSRPHHDKTRFSPSLTISDIPTSRMLDPAFWASAMGLWARAEASEYCRVEVIYDVLLPWLANGPLLPSCALHDENAVFRSPTRSAAGGAWKPALEAVKFLLRESFDKEQLKMFTSELRANMLSRAALDLAHIVSLNNFSAVSNFAPVKPDYEPASQDCARSILQPISVPTNDGSLALSGANGATVTINETAVLLYFTKSSCEHCTDFDPKLKEALTKLDPSAYTLVVVALDGDAQELAATKQKCEAGCALLAPEDQTKANAIGKLTSCFGVSGVPDLVSLKAGSAGRWYVQNLNCVKAVLQGKDFPWPAQPRCLSLTETKLLNFSTELVGLNAVKASENGRLNYQGLLLSSNLTGEITSISSQLQGPPSNDELLRPPALQPEVQTVLTPLLNGSLLLGGKADAFAGPAKEVKPPDLPNFLSVSTSASTTQECLEVLSNTDKVVNELMRRSGDGIVTSQLALKMQALELITSVFTCVLPTPVAMDSPQEVKVKCAWQGVAMLGKKVQLAAMSIVHGLVLSLASLSQSVESPTRPSDAVRALSASAMLAIFDALLRIIPTAAGDTPDAPPPPPADPAAEDAPPPEPVWAPLAMSMLLGEDGGYALDQGVCQDHRPYQRSCSTMELIDPKHSIKRDSVLAYLASTRKCCASRLFDLRQPDHLELSKYSATIGFLRQLLGLCGYEVVPAPPGGGRPPPEMEALMDWMLNDQSPFASHESGRAFLMARDVVFLFKFLSTMETRESELMRKRKQINRFAHFSLSFDPSGGFSGQTSRWAMRRGVVTGASHRRPLQWEPVNFRGVDMSIADISVTGFGSRTLMYGEGMLTRSPADVGRLAPDALPKTGGSKVGEDDVLFADELPTFGGTLSKEESEAVLSYLTVPYVRIPLIVGFFSSRDRAAYLMNTDLQGLFSAALFEGGTWSRSSQTIESVPMRDYAAKVLGFGETSSATGGRGEQDWEDVDGTTVSPDAALGTRYGLLLNELDHAPDAVMAPLMTIFKCCTELKNCSVYSPDASFILFLTQTAVNVEAHLTHAAYHVECTSADLDVMNKQLEKTRKLRSLRSDLREFLHGPIASILDAWLVESKQRNDLPTTCVVHGYRALLYSNSIPEELSHEASPDCGETVFVRLVGGIGFVNNWHGFGLGQQRSDLLRCADPRDAEQRLLRFLQSQGVDTSAHLQPGSLDKYLTGRPLYLNIGGEVIKVPTVARAPEDSSGDQPLASVPPADVPEYQLFATMQRLRPSIVKYVDSLASPAHELGGAIRIILRVPMLHVTGWVQRKWAGGATGRWDAQGAELTIDLQTTEVLWRDDELKPVPDSMTQFVDYASLFGKQALHCGVVVKQEHRHWVHVVGSDYDLIEWDVPEYNLLGVNGPECNIPIEKKEEEQQPGQPPRQPPRQPQVDPMQLMLLCSQGVEESKAAEALAAVAPGGAEEAMMWIFSGGAQAGGQGGAQEAVKEEIFVTFEGIRFDRKVDPYNEAPWTEPCEQWGIDILKPVIVAVFPPDDDEKKLKYDLFLPHDVGGTDGNSVMRLVGCDRWGEEDATWKEVVVHKTWKTLHVFNLLSHGRRVFRSQVYSSQSSLSLACLEPSLGDRAPMPPIVAKQAGNFKDLRQPEGSLVITRFGGEETMVPGRLLSGVVPTALLESYRFWQRSGSCELTGEPLDSDDPWFGDTLKIWPDQNAHMGEVLIQRVKKPPSVSAASSPRSPSKQTSTSSSSEPPSQGPSLLRHRSIGNGENDNIDAGVLAQLTEIGYSDVASRTAYKAVTSDGQKVSKDDLMLKAMDWLNDPTNTDAVELAEAMAMSMDMEDTMDSGPDGSKEVESGPQVGLLSSSHTAWSVTNSPKLTLLNLMATQDSVLGRLAMLLSRVEDLSHVLCWTSEQPSNSPKGDAWFGSTHLALVELPRLKLKMAPRLERDGQVRLWLTDHAGWFVSDRFASGSDTGGRWLDQLFVGLGQSLLLESEGEGLQLLVPNHDLHRPKVKGEPFSTMMVPDRANSDWQEIMSTRYYLYQVHTSLSFLRTPSLAAALYLCLCRFLARDFSSAAAVVTTCTVDVPFSGEEAWIMGKFDRAADDQHPDAHAVRLKLSLMVAFSDNKVPWEVHQEMNRYLAKLPHVSTTCRLSDDEEISVLRLCKQGSPVLRNRLDFLLVNRSSGVVTLKGPSPRWGGQPWRHLNSLNIHHLNSVGQKAKRLHYKRPGKPTELGTASLKERRPDEIGGRAVRGGGYMFGGGFGMPMDEDDDEDVDMFNQVRQPPRKQALKPDQEIVMMLVSMGFTENAAARSALGSGNKGVAEAQEWAFQHMDDANFNDEMKDDDEEAGAKSADKQETIIAQVEVNEEVLSSLMSMGFSEPGCRRACIANKNNADACMEWIFAHMEDEGFNDPIPEETPATKEAKEGTGASDETLGSEQVSMDESLESTTTPPEVGEGGVKRDVAGEPKLTSENQTVQSEESGTSLAPLASVETAPSTQGVPSPDVNGLTFDFSQFSSNTPTSTPAATQGLDISAMVASLTAANPSANTSVPSTNQNATPQGLDINAMVASLSAASQAQSSNTTTAVPPAPVAPVSVDNSLSIVADDECIDLILGDAVVGDEESGANRQLGFCFLFEVLTGAVTLKLVDKDVSKSLAEIMLRYMHLKSARWGRETVDSGEVESAPSRHFAQLAALIQHASHNWPSLPADGNSTARLKHGFNLKRSAPPSNPFDPNPRPPPPKTAIHTWLEQLDRAFNKTMNSEPRYQLEDKWREEAQTLSRAKLDYSEVRSVGDVSAYSPVQRHYYETVPPLDAVVVDTSCAARVLSGDAEVMSLAKHPLAVIGLQQLVSLQSDKVKTLDSLPFDLTQHKDAQSAVAKDLLQRLEADVRAYASMTAQEKVFDLVGLEQVSLCLQPGFDYEKLNAGFDQLQKILLSLVARDHQEACQELCAAVDVANRLNEPEDEATAVAQLHFQLRRGARQHGFVEPNLLTRSLMSSSAATDLRNINPFLTDRDIAAMLDRLPVTLLRFNRVAHANRALACLGRLRELVVKLQECVLLSKPLEADGMNIDEPVSDSESRLANLSMRVEQSSKALVTQLLSDRHYVSESAQGVVSVDPRFLVFEYAFDILLRARQVEMVRSFVTATIEGDGRVQQMIMGAGKTTVIGPLLTLLLADGNHLVVQVMPSALLDMSRNVLRKCFTCPLLPKRVYTLMFDRSVDDSAELVQALCAKLSAAEKGRGVVVAAPEAIKSLMLKLVEQLHAIEEVDLEALLPNNSSRHNRESVRLRDAMVRRSDMADALVPVLDLWSRALLVMDEVDVLLHPLRSELNFPVGHKVPIDLGAHRWNLPFFLLDVLVTLDSEQRSNKKTENVRPCEASSTESSDYIRQLKDALDDGYSSHALQRQPHLVLLDHRWYARVLRPVVAQWMVNWVVKEAPTVSILSSDDLIKYMTCSVDDLEVLRARIETLDVSTIKLLNLTRSWVLTLLPHVLSKIHRVSFGILRPSDLTMVDPKSPPSRKLLAVPFVGKDVPSRASEFAHPDVLIGLSILAYRYDGMRLSDVQRLSSQLKQDLSRQVGPRSLRPAAQTFDGWLDTLRAQASPVSQSSSLSIALPDEGANLEPPKLQRTPSAVGRDAVEVLPLALFQPTDPVQLGRLKQCIAEYPPSIHYYLRQHVFPALMNFQATKISACGHELGSSILFGKRIGFSGTPSNLLPMDLGDCQYEPGSDGRVLSVLTYPSVVNIEQKASWSAKMLLSDVATAYERTQVPVHALIDTGALITGMDNLAVASFLLTHLNPTLFDGVVYLDSADRQMILMRGNQGRPSPLAQVGLPPERRFTFYDQVHTTGMDIKQGPSANAVLTIGKDMTFRDYAQGAFRMRQIGQGQTLTLYLIPEVSNRMADELAMSNSQSSNPLVDVPAWLLLNSMKMEALQFIQLSQQELQNVWRKEALGQLLQEAKSAKSREPMGRLRRFEHEMKMVGLRRCVELFREPLGILHDISPQVPQNSYFADKVDAMVAQHDVFAPNGSKGAQRIASVRLKTLESKSQSKSSNASEMAMETMVVNEAEAEAEEEAEEEAEQEEQKMSAFGRDDEQANPWNVSELSAVGSASTDGSHPFYSLSHFKATKDQPMLNLPKSLLFSDNYFRPRWVGLGDRRLKNVVFVLEVVKPQVDFATRMATLHSDLVSSGKCSDANEAAAEALRLLLDPQEQANMAEQRYLAVLSLAEGETIRRALHISGSDIPLALRTLDGGMDYCVDTSRQFKPSQSIELAASMQCLRFLNCDMYYTDEEMDLLLQGLVATPINDRVSFFASCQVKHHFFSIFWFFLIIISCSACVGVNATCGETRHSPKPSLLQTNGHNFTLGHYCNKWALL
mmetsp:Transcript_2150/g.2909  ORF Transcript_2150/g.2909 Transcript_2150/m.2909 type:complete len:4480 (+) Transcript_2150:77-13516(+)